MLKHVQVSPLRARADSVSLRSCASSSCGSPEPPGCPLGSRASSYSSLSEPAPQTTIKIYTQCLRQDIEYKTLSITYDTTCREVIAQVMRRCKMRHRDPRLFYLTMEVTVRRAGVRTLLVLDEAARPGALQSCHPRGDSRFCLQTHRGGLVKVHDSAIFSSSQYKSLLISDQTTSDELLTLLLSCYNSTEAVEQFSLYEVCPSQEYQRKLHPDDLPLRAQASWSQRGHTPSHFLVRRNPDYRPLGRRKQLLSPQRQEPTHSPITSQPHISSKSLQSLTLSPINTKPFEQKFDSTGELHQHEKNDQNSIQKTNQYKKCESALSKETNQSLFNFKTRFQNEGIVGKRSCKICKNNYKSCEFCCTNNTSTKFTKSCSQINCYSPVYNVRSINNTNNSLTSCFNSLKIESIKTSTPITSPTLRDESNKPIGGLRPAETLSSMCSSSPSSSSSSSTGADYENFFYI